MVKQVGISLNRTQRSDDLSVLFSMRRLTMSGTDRPTRQEYCCRAKGQRNNLSRRYGRTALRGRSQQAPHSSSDRSSLHSPVFHPNQTESSTEPSRTLCAGIDHKGREDSAVGGRKPCRPAVQRANLRRDCTSPNMIKCTSERPASIQGQSMVSIPPENLRFGGVW